MLVKNNNISWFAMNSQLLVNIKILQLENETFIVILRLQRYGTYENRRIHQNTE